MGGSSRSSNATETSNTQGNVQDNQGVAFGAVDGNISLEMLDGGAIGDAFDFAKESQAFLGQNFASVLGLIEATTQDAIAAGSQSANTVAAAYESQQSSGAVPVVMMALAGVAVIGVIVAIKK